MIISVRVDCCAETWLEFSLTLIYQIENQVTIRHNIQSKRTVVKSTLLLFSVRIISSSHKLKKATLNPVEWWSLMLNHSFFSSWFFFLHNSIHFSTKLKSVEQNTLNKTSVENPLKKDFLFFGIFPCWHFIDLFVFFWRFLEHTDFSDSFSEQGYWTELKDLKDLYREEERPGLLELVGWSYF